MAYAIFELKKDNINIIEEIKKDDLISRQSLWTRDAKSLDVKGDTIFFKIEGDNQAIAKAEELLSETSKMLVGSEKEKINEKFIEDEDKASEGMGFIFG